MENLNKYKLSQFRDIRPLNKEETAVLSYNVLDDTAYVIKHVEAERKPLYEKLRNIRNGHLPEIYDIIDDDSQCIIIEEYIKGSTLERVISEKKSLPEDTACRYIADICDALRSTHSLNIIHRDISPDNIIINENNEAVLLDFDIAREKAENKSTDTTILGTAGFASPEQYGFAQTDVRSDIYSLGVLLNYMLTGHILQEQIYNKNEDLYNIIKKATAMDSDKRYAGVALFMNDISKVCRIPGVNIRKHLTPEEFINTVPGFRSKKTWRMVTAIFFYVNFILFALREVINGTSFSFFLGEMLMYWAVFILPMWWFGNGGKQWDIIPFIRSYDHKNKRTVAIAAYVIFLTFFSLLPGILMQLS